MQIPSIKIRLILVLAIILCLTFIAINTANYHVSKAAIRSEIVRSSLPLTLDNIHFEIQADLMRPIFISSLMANDSFLKEWTTTGEKDPGKIIKYLHDIRNKYNFISTFFISATTLKYYHFKGIHKTISPEDTHDIWYYKFVAIDTEYSLDVDTDEAAENRLTIFINFRVENEKGELLGVTGVGLELNNIADFLKSYRARFGRSVYMTDLKGTIQIHSDPKLVEKLSLHSMKGIGALADRILVQNTDPQDFSFTRNKKNVLLTVRFMPLLDWYLIVEQEEDLAFTAIRKNLLQNLTIGGVAILVVVIAVAFTVNLFQTRLELMAITDELTGIANRRFFEEQYRRAVHRHDRTGELFSIILFDLDGFKAVNDYCGHIIGDQVLKSIAQVTTTQVRKVDLLARWGGDEFIVLIHSNQQDAKYVAERIRREVEIFMTDYANGATDDPRQKVTISIGVTQYKKSDSLDIIMNRADKALYSIKSTGGNGVRIADNNAG